MPAGSSRVAKMRLTLRETSSDEVEVKENEDNFEYILL